MAVIRTKNYVPDVYVSESRDFQLFLRVLDFVQNSLKYDIDTMLCSLSTQDIPSQYLERLKSKLGFYTSHTYEDDSLRLALTVFPFIIRYKGSKEGIARCVAAYLRHIGVRGQSKLEILNNPDYLIRIGLPTNLIDTTLLMDLLSFILPTGYFVEITFYKDIKVAPTPNSFVDRVRLVKVSKQEENTSVRTKINDELSNELFSTVQLGMVYNPNNMTNEDQLIEESDTLDE